MATIKELMGDIGKNGAIVMNGLSIDVVVDDVKVSYGKTRWLVHPVSGLGQIWVESINLP